MASEFDLFFHAESALTTVSSSIRIFEKHLTRIAKLHYHRDTVQAVAHVEERHCKKFAQDDKETPFGESDSSDEEQDTASLDLSCLLVTGGKEGRICLWQVS